MGRFTLDAGGRTPFLVATVAVVLVVSAGFVLHYNAVPSLLPHGVSAQIPGVRPADNSSNVTEFSDIFENDTSLNTTAWFVNGTYASSVLSGQGAQTLSGVPPTLGFSKNQGLTLSGVTSDYTFANLQSNGSFAPPFSVQTNVEVTAAHGVTLVFGLTSASLTQGLAFIGNFNASNPYYVLGLVSNSCAGCPWDAVAALDASPALDTWYRLTISVDADGLASAALSQNGVVLGSAQYDMGSGSYYVYIGQYVDAPSEGNGPNSASYQWVYVNATGGLPPGPTVEGLVADPSNISLGQSTEIETFETGGVSPLTVSYTDLPPGCASKNALAFACVPTAVGTYTPTVTVTDSFGRSGQGSTGLTVGAGPPPEIVSFLADPSTITIGSSTTLEGAVVNGAAPFTMSYAGLPAGCSSESTLELSCTPTQVGTFEVVLTVTDGLGRSAQAGANLTVEPGPPPVVVGFIADPSTIPLGGSTSLNAFVVNGTAPLSVAYRNLPPGCSSSSTLELSCTPDQSGHFNITVTVTDDLDRSSSGMASLTVEPAVVSLPSIEAAFASPLSIVLGQSTSITVIVEGGTSPLSFDYTGVPPGCATHNSSSFSCKPTAVGNYTIVATVTDAQGHQVTDTFDLNVTAVPKATVESSPGPTFTEFGIALAIGAVGIGMGVVGLVVAVRRRSGGQEKE